MSVKKNVYILSDSVGETAELVSRAAASQFDLSQIELHRISYIQSTKTIADVLLRAQKSKSIIVFTIVVPHLRNYLLEEAQKANIHTVDIMGPTIDGMQLLFSDVPRLRPGRVHQLDEEYYRKVEAIEFAVKHDDGRHPQGLLNADLILIGVSRTSKTPLSMYLASKRVKTANIPLIPEVPPSQELFKFNPQHCFGLTIRSEKLVEIRTERLKSLGLKARADYAQLERIQFELQYAEQLMTELGCQVIDVSSKAVEETAKIILEKMGSF